MNIYEYFKDYNDKFYLMKDKLVAIKEAERNYVTLTGNKITDTPKTSLNKNFDFSDQLAKIEKMLISYKKVEKEYLNLSYNSHRALDDSYTCNSVYQYCKNKHKNV